MIVTSSSLYAGAQQFPPSPFCLKADMDAKTIATLKRRKKLDNDNHEILSQPHMSFSGVAEAHKWKRWLKFSIALNVLLLLCVQLCIWVFLGSYNKNPARHVDNQCWGRGSYDAVAEKCRCYPCFQGNDCSQTVPKCVIYANQGDPVIFEKYWLRNAEAAATHIRAHELISYFSNREGLCWFMEPELEKEIRILHGLVGNAVTEGRHIIVGTGSSQLFQAALYALSKQEFTTNIISAAPYYSVYPIVSDYLQAGIYKWAGNVGRQTTKAPYIEIITSPNNPDGEIRHPVLNGSGYQIYDLAYYWPHYTPITSPLDEDIMLFALSKGTGHAGSRIGWAIVKDKDVAKRMVKAIELTTIGVSKDSQTRASQILKHINGIYGKLERSPYKMDQYRAYEQIHLNFFHYGYSVMEIRWKRLREALSGGNRFSLPNFQPEFCNFFGQEVTSNPAYAWFKCEIEEDCEKVLESEGIQARGGRYFGVDPKYVRVSMLERDFHFEILVDRLAAIKNV